MLIILIIYFLFYRIYNEHYKKEYFLNDKLIGYQQCGNLVNSFPTFLQCKHFKNIINSDIKRNGITNKTPLKLQLDNNKQYHLEVNTYQMDKRYLTETTNCKQFISWIMDYCRYRL